MTPFRLFSCLFGACKDETRISKKTCHSFVALECVYFFLSLSFAFNLFVLTGALIYKCLWLPCNSFVNPECFPESVAFFSPLTLT